MREEGIRFLSGGLRIEGLLCIQGGERGVVITHPHPLYGGTMYNQVVETLATIYQGKGFSTLRFNFRGVGESQGSYDQGKGERADVRSALRYLCDRGKRQLHLAGYSFGAWVNAKITNTESMLSSMIMVSPPVTFLDFSFLSFNPRIEAVVTGDRDDIAAVDRIRSLVDTWNPRARLEIIEGADHFYSGRMDILKSVLSRIIH